MRVRAWDRWRLEWKQRMAGVNHHAVAKQVYTESRTTAGYFLLLTLANLIALCGLLANSIPVIIGAMLISPLMGPILSFGFGFITGDVVVLRQAARKIGMSVALTLVVAAIASIASPLQIATSEIMARTQPNLFDLLIAIFAGTAGAGALCTKRSVLTIIPGVAIATAVIPPLSVCGYGIGTSQWAIAWGGFFLFFTNFVAITLVTGVVFLSYGFRPGEGATAAPGSLRNRMLALTGVLVLISIPLGITLHSSLSELRRHRVIRAVLQQHFDRERLSKVSSLNHKLLQDGTVAVSAALNTTEYRSQEEVVQAEAELAKMLGRPAKMYLEQIKTLEGGAISSAAPAVRIRSPGEVFSESQADLRKILEPRLEKLSGLMSPSKVVASSITFGPGSPPISVRLSMKRDLSLTPEEHRWLQKWLSAELEQPLLLEVDLVPLVAPLSFLPGQATLNPEQENLLREVGRLYHAGAGPFLRLNSIPENSRATRAAMDRMVAAKRFLTDQCAVPQGSVKGRVTSKSSPDGPVLEFRFSSVQEDGQ